MFTHAHSFYKGFVETGGGGPPWEYASLAAAESSGDSWADGVDVTITGGALFIYDATLAVDSYSGLIHKYPWDGTGTIAALDQVDSIANSTAQGSDPDTWSDWTKTVVSGGVADTSGGRSRLIAPTTNDVVTMTSDIVPATADLESFMIIPLISAGFTGTDSSGSVPYVSNGVFARNSSDTANVGARLELSRTRSTTLWDVEVGGNTLTTKTVSVERRAWLYTREDNWAVWFDDDATPEVSGVVSGAVGAAMATMYADSAGTTTDVFNKLHQVVVGVMSTS